MCTMVPPNHQGPVPGVEVGMTWKFRVQASTQNLTTRIGRSPLCMLSFMLLQTAESIAVLHRNILAVLVVTSHLLCDGNHSSLILYLVEIMYSIRDLYAR